MRRTWAAAAVLWLLAMSGCGVLVTASASCPSGGTDLTYANFGESFMASYCISCHGPARAEEGVDVSSATKVSANRSKTLREAGTSSAMPPAGSSQPSSAERALLAEWLSCGAP